MYIPELKAHFAENRRLNICCSEESDDWAQVLFCRGKLTGEILCTLGLPVSHHTFARRGNSHFHMFGEAPEVAQYYSRVPLCCCGWIQLFICVCFCFPFTSRFQWSFILVMHYSDRFRDPTLLSPVMLCPLSAEFLCIVLQPLAHTSRLILRFFGFLLQNDSDVPASYQFQLDDVAAFQLDRPQGQVAPRSTQQLVFTFKPSQSINYYKRVFCLTKNQEPIVSHSFITLFAIIRMHCCSKLCPYILLSYPCFRFRTIQFVDLVGTCYDDKRRPAQLTQAHVDAAQKHALMGLGRYVDSCMWSWQIASGRYLAESHGDQATSLL